MGKGWARWDFSSTISVNIIESLWLYNSHSFMHLSSSSLSLCFLFFSHFESILLALFSIWFSSGSVCLSFYLSVYMSFCLMPIFIYLINIFILYIIFLQPIILFVNSQPKKCCYWFGSLLLLKVVFVVYLINLL